jgi:hypothetical protein
MTLDRLDTVIAFAVIMLGVSLLITVLTQMVSAFFGLRGSNLVWGVTTVLTTAEPKLADKAESLARRILTRPLISDSTFSRWENAPVAGPLLERWRMATAIRPDELVRALGEIAGRLSAPGPAQDQAVADAIGNMLAAVDPEADRKLRMIEGTFKTLTTQWTGQAEKIIQQVTDSTRQSVGKLETCFASAMDRVSQRFATQMRIWTVVFAVVIAFGAHLDTLKLLEQLAVNPAERNALVGQRDNMLQEAGTVMIPPAVAASAPAGGTVVAPGILNAAMDSLKEDPAGAGLGKAPEFATYADVVAWLHAQGQDALVPEFQQAVANTLKQEAINIDHKLAAGGFQLVPRPYPHPWFQGWRNLFGIVISAALLSLGAPFWFNALKSLSSLRPILAQSEKQGTAKA